MISDLLTNTSVKGQHGIERMRDDGLIPRPSGWATRSKPGRFTPM
jgi:hypothetical protein